MRHIVSSRSQFVAHSNTAMKVAQAYVCVCSEVSGAVSDIATYWLEGSSRSSACLAGFYNLFVDLNVYCSLSRSSTAQCGHPVRV